MGGTVRITAANVNSARLRKPLGVAPGDYICIAVADSGVGMSEQVLARACEPFFTTKPPGQGSGLGLAQVYGVARQSGGDLAIESSVGKGTTVELYLPRSVGPAQSANARNAAHNPQTNRTATALVVDDQEDVRDVAVTHLGALGYRVLAASDGKAALDLFEAEKGKIDLLVADYSMAGMTGVELAHLLRERQADLPVVIISGYFEPSGLNGPLCDAVVLKKPYRFDGLATGVERALRRCGRVAPPAKVVALRRA